MTKFVDTLLQPISKSQKSYLSLNGQMWKTEHFLFRWTLWVLIQIYRKTRVFKLPVKHIKIYAKTTYSYTLPAGNALTNRRRKFLPLQWKALPTNPWNCSGHKDNSFLCQHFHGIYLTTTLSRTVFKPTVWKCYINDISPYGTYVNQTSKPSLKKQTYITRLLNSRLKHLTLRLCF